MSHFVSQSHRQRIASPCSIPLSVGIAIETKTRLGGCEGLRCQDAAAFDMGENYLVAVVCDGCGGYDPPLTSGRLTSDSSATEVGAILMSEMTLQEISAAQEKHSFSKKTPDEIQAAVLAAVASVLKRLRRLLPRKHKEERIAFVDRFLNTTIQILIITEQHVMVLGCGDGVLEFNQESISFDSQAGQYLCAPLAPEKRTERKLERRILKPFNELTSLTLASDGWEALASDLKIPSLAKVISANLKREPGIDDDFLPRLRMATGGPNGSRPRLRDDVALIHIEKIIPLCQVQIQ